MERNCKTCLWNSMFHHGCCSWDCDYINRKEAAEAWREKHSKEDVEMPEYEPFKDALDAMTDCHFK